MEHDVKLISVVKQTLTRALLTPSDSASIAIRKKKEIKNQNFQGEDRSFFLLLEILLDFVLFL